MDEAQWILREAEKCLYCGFCEAVCPTLPLGPHRGYGPRGRVSIAAEAVTRGELGPEALASIYTCLTCGACTVKCPSAIPVADMVKAVRRLYASGRLRAPRVIKVKVVARAARR